MYEQFPARPKKLLWLPMRCVIALLLAGCGAASTTDAVVSADPPAWLEGSWRAERDDGATEEVWARVDGRLLGFNRSVDADGHTTHHELLRVDGRGYVAAPEGQAVTRFAASEGTASSQRFENPSHDFPKWLTYDLEGEELVARIGGDTATPLATWRFARTGDAPAHQSTEAELCPDEGGARLTVSGCHCAAQLYCAEIEGELVAAIVDQSCDACEEVSATCATAAPAACETRTVETLLLVRD